MRKVPPGIQIIPSVCGAPVEASGLNVVAGKSVVISRAASRSIAEKLRSGPGASYAGALSQAIGPWSNIEAVQPARTSRRPRTWIAYRDIGRVFRLRKKQP